MKSLVVQSGNKADGDIVAGDKNTFVTQERAGTLMSRLIELYKEEIKNSPPFAEILDELADYISTPEGGNLKTLEQKLNDADRSQEYAVAVRLKEKFAKKFAKNNHSKSAQQIFCLIMTSALERFRSHILPLINAGVSRQEVDSTVYEKVLLPVYQELETNVLTIYQDEIRGLLYYLTGNCHIRWKVV